MHSLIRYIPPFRNQIWAAQSLLVPAFYRCTCMHFYNAQFYHNTALVKLSTGALNFTTLSVNTRPSLSTARVCLYTIFDRLLYDTPLVSFILKLTTIFKETNYSCRVSYGPSISFEGNEGNEALS